MSALAPGDFGDTSDLLAALGLVTSGGDFNGDWLGDPERYLKTILADQNQREALLDFVEAVADGSTERDAENRQWIELFSDTLANGASIGFFLVVDEQPANEVHLFVGVRFDTDAPLAQSSSSLMFPLFRVRKSESTSPPPLSPELVGNQLETLSSQPRLLQPWVKEKPLNQHIRFQQVVGARNFHCLIKAMERQQFNCRKWVAFACPPS